MDIQGIESAAADNEYGLRRSLDAYRKMMPAVVMRLVPGENIEQLLRDAKHDILDLAAAVGDRDAEIADLRERLDYREGLLKASEQQQKEPRIDKPCLVGHGRFGVGVKVSTVIAAAQRHYENEVTPEKEAKRIAEGEGKLQALRQEIEEPTVTQPCRVGAIAFDIGTKVADVIEAAQRHYEDTEAQQSGLQQATQQLGEIDQQWAEGFAASLAKALSGLQPSLIDRAASAPQAPGKGYRWVPEKLTKRMHVAMSEAMVPSKPGEAFKMQRLWDAALASVAASDGGFISSSPYADESNTVRGIGHSHIDGEERQIGTAPLRPAKKRHHVSVLDQNGEVVSSVPGYVLGGSVTWDGGTGIKTITVEVKE